MQIFRKTLGQLGVIGISTLLGACVVKPKTVASYDEKCMVSTQKVVLTAEQFNAFNLDNCVASSCKAELVNAIVISTLATTASAVVSGSIALVGNTLYWMESQGKCPNMAKPSEQEQRELQTPGDDYQLVEEIITAKS